MISPKGSLRVDIQDQILYRSRNLAFVERMAKQTTDSKIKQLWLASAADSETIIRRLMK